MNNKKRRKRGNRKQKKRETKLKISLFLSKMVIGQLMLINCDTM